MISQVSVSFPVSSFSTSRRNCSFGNTRALCNQVAQSNSCPSRRALKKLVVPAGLRAVVSYVEVEYQMSERHACRLMGLGRTTYRYRARKAERDSELRARLKNLAAKGMRFGYRRLTAMLVREGVPTNHKRLYRLYREEGWAMRIRQRGGSAGGAR